MSDRNIKFWLATALWSSDISDQTDTPANNVTNQYNPIGIFSTLDAAKAACQRQLDAWCEPEDTEVLEWEVLPGWSHSAQRSIAGEDTVFLLTLEEVDVQPGSLFEGQQS